MFDEGTAGIVPYLQSDRVVTLNAGSEILPGVHTIAAPGYTAGHTMYRVESDGHAIVFFGDLVHSAEVQMLDPSVAIWTRMKRRRSRAGSAGFQSLRMRKRLRPARTPSFPDSDMSYEMVWASLDNF